MSCRSFSRPPSRSVYIFRPVSFLELAECGVVRAYHGMLYSQPLALSLKNDLFNLNLNLKKRTP